jgi:hypothetical protein
MSHCMIYYNVITRKKKKKMKKEQQVDTSYTQEGIGHGYVPTGQSKGEQRDGKRRRVQKAHGT